MSISQLLSPNNLDLVARSISTSGSHPDGAMQIGEGAIASGALAIAIGNTALASGNGAISLGNNTVSSNTYGIAVGQGAAAANNFDITFGNGTVAGTGVVQIAGLAPVPAAVVTTFTHSLPVNINGTTVFLKLNTVV